MAKVIITGELEEEVNKRFKIESIKIFKLMKSLEENPKKGKIVGQINGIVIKEIWSDLGLSVDWSLLYSTIDKRVQRVSQLSFIELYEKGREYRKEVPYMWCPVCQTAIAQVELEDKEFDSTFNDIVFKVDNKDLIIATTRPELLPSCVALLSLVNFSVIVPSLADNGIEWNAIEWNGIECNGIK